MKCFCEMIRKLACVLQGCLSYNIQFISTLLSFILFFLVVSALSTACRPDMNAACCTGIDSCFGFGFSPRGSSDVWWVGTGVIHGEIPRTLRVW